MKLILLGAPGSGKGTQAEKIAEMTGVMHVSSGDLFRKAEKDGTDLGKLAKSYMEKGQLVPDELVVKMVLEHIAGNKKGFILDGSPSKSRTCPAMVHGSSRTHTSRSCSIPSPSPSAACDASTDAESLRSAFLPR